jgi:membrane associated rhomboid family serine protease
MTPWVLRIVLATIAVFFLQNTVPAINETLAFVPQLALQRPWTFVTYMFLHASGFGHIFFNMLTLFFFGPRVEDRLGGKAFLGLYFTSGISGALLSIPVGYPIIGASGAIFGVLLAYAWFWPRNQMLIWGIIPIEARYMVLLMTGISLYFGFGGAGGGNVAHFAHLGGFVGGYIFLKLLQRNAGNERFKRQMQAPAPKIETTAGALDRWRRIKREGLHEVNRDELDRILDKIGASGIASLTPGEREFLDRFSARH